MRLALLLRISELLIIRYRLQGDPNADLEWLDIAIAEHRQDLAALDKRSAA